MKGGVKRLDLSFPIILQEVNSNLKICCSVTKQASEVDKEVLPLGRAPGACTVCQREQTRMAPTGHLAIPQGPLGSTISSHQPSQVKSQESGQVPSVRFTEALLLREESPEGRVLPFYLCITQNKCSRNETV